MKGSLLLYNLKLTCLFFFYRAADGQLLVILAWTVFAWSTRVTDGQTDRIAMAKTRWKHSCFRA